MYKDIMARSDILIIAGYTVFFLLLHLIIYIYNRIVLACASGFLGYVFFFFFFKARERQLTYVQDASRPTSDKRCDASDDYDYTEVEYRDSSSRGVYLHAKKRKLISKFLKFTRCVTGNSVRTIVRGEEPESRLGRKVEDVSRAADSCRRIYMHIIQ